MHCTMHCTMRQLLQSGVTHEVFLRKNCQLMMSTHMLEQQQASISTQTETQLKMVI